MVVEFMYLSIVPLLFSFVFLAIFGRKIKKISPFVAIIMAAVSFSIVVLGLMEYKQPLQYNFNWLSIGNINLEIGFQIDSLSMLFAFLVSFVSLLVLIYSYSYMGKKDDIPRFFAEMSLFAGSMLGIVMSSNLVTMFIFWEIVGLSSYLLIGFWYYRKEVAAAAKRAFVIIALSDIFMFVGIALLATQYPSLNFNFLNTSAVNSQTLMIALSLILIGGIAKSAQFPLHVWLGDAMEGPTPVSTLLHSATMVKAGVFLVARMLPLFALVNMLPTITIIGALSAFVGATIAFSEMDIKRVLAFSTVSQLGFMMLALGTNSLGSSMAYSFTQTFSKASIFMIAGIIMHAFKDERNLGKISISPKSKIFIIALVGMLAMSGLPPFGDFFGKDSVLNSAFGYNYITFGFIFLTAFVSTLYISRWFFIQCGNFRQAKSSTKKERIEEHTLHQIPKAMLLPTVLLLIGTVVSALFVSSIFQFFGEVESINWVLSSISALIVAAAIGISYTVFYKRTIEPEKFSQLPLVSLVHKAFVNKYWIDTAYDKITVGIIRFVFSGLYLFDRYVVDGMVNLICQSWILFFHFSDLVDTYVIDGAVNSFYRIGDSLGDSLKRLQSGTTQNYIAGILAGSILLIILLQIAKMIILGG